MVEDFRHQYNAKYVVVKSSTRYPAEISLSLQDAGFWLIENQISLKLTRENAIKALEEHKEFLDDISYRLADESDMQLIYSEIEKGIFKTDRIALDPNFGVEIANRRYAFWIKDALKNGAHVYLSLYENKPVGFFVGKSTQNKKSNGLLSGNFTNSESYLQGAFNFLAGHKCFLDSNININQTAVSSNNLDVLRLHLMLGRTITGIKNVLVKHYD